MKLILLLKASFRLIIHLFCQDLQKMSSQQQEQEIVVNDHNPVLASPDILTPPATQTPILAHHIGEITAREDLLVDEIDTLIRQFLVGPNHQSPYSFTFRWTVDDEPIFNYSASLTIHEPSR